MPAKSVTGLKKETAAALSYVLFALSGFFMLVMEKDPYVRFHAMQSIVFSIVFFALITFLTITVILAPLGSLLFLVMFVFWLVLIYKASQGERWALPILGKYVEKLL